MKTSMILALGIALTTTACQNDAEFASPTTRNDATFTITPAGTLTALDDPVGLTACEDVITQHTMQGNGIMLSSTAAGFRNRTTYAIQAQGPVQSDPLDNGQSEIRFTYNQATRIVSGQLMTKFDNGNAIEMQLQGVAQQTINGQMMTLKMQIASGDLMMDPGHMTLMNGTIAMVLPVNPVGAIAMSVTTKGVYCETD